MPKSTYIIIWLYVAIIAQSITLSLVALHAQSANVLSPEFRILLREFENVYSSNTPLTQQSKFIESLKCRPYIEFDGYEIYSKGLIKLNNNAAIDQIMDNGGRIKKISDKLFTLRYPVNKLSKLSSINGIEYFQAGVSLYPTLDSVRRVTGADLVQLGTNLNTKYDGKGVIVGIIDSGFDYLHPAFLADNSQSRILKVWEQTSTEGTPPDGFDYGVEFKPDPFATKKYDKKDNSHGTHVASIAAGYSPGTFGGFKGIAPNANLILVSYRWSQEDRNSTASVDLLEGIDYIFKNADLLGMPAVVNISLGTQMGPHDGTSLFDQAVSELMDSGKIVVKSAGNTGFVFCHIRKNFSPNDDTIKTFTKFLSRTVNSSFDIWGSKNSDFCVRLMVWDTARKDFSAASNLHCTKDNSTELYNFIDSKGNNFQVAIASGVEGFNNKPRALISFTGKCADFVRLDVYSKDATVDIWKETYQDHLPFTNLFIDGYLVGDSYYQVSEPGNGEGITVGSFVSKKNYKTLYKGELSIDSNVGEISQFTAKGPRADDLVKPDICAPGEIVAAAVNRYDDDYSQGGLFDRDIIIEDFDKGDYAMLSGTSMSSPVVAGTVALMLSHSPDLTHKNALAIIKRTAIKDQFTGVLPIDGDFQWGNGKLNILGIMRELENPSNIFGTINQGFDVYPNPFHDQIIIDFPQNVRISNIRIIEPNGNEIYSMDLHQVRSINGSFLINHDFSTIARGVYLLLVNSDKGVLFQKLIKN